MKIRVLRRYCIVATPPSLLQMDDYHLEGQHAFSEVKYLDINVITEMVLFLSSSRGP